MLVSSRPTGRRSIKVEVTPEMIKAGEAVLDRAFEFALCVPSPAAISALSDVYIAMESERRLEERRAQAVRAA